MWRLGVGVVPDTTEQAADRGLEAALAGAVETSGPACLAASWAARLLPVANTSQTLEEILAACVRLLGRGVPQSGPPSARPERVIESDPEPMT